MRNLIIPATAALLLGSAAFAQTTTPPSTAPSVSGSGAMSDQERACRNIANPSDRTACLNNLQLRRDPLERGADTGPSAISPSAPGATGSIGTTGGADSLSGGRALGDSTGTTGGSLGGSTTGTTGSGIGGTGASGGASGGAGGASGGGGR